MGKYRSSTLVMIKRSRHEKKKKKKNVWLLATAEQGCSKAASTASKCAFTSPYHASFARTEMRLQKSHRYEKHGYSRDRSAEALAVPPLTSSSCPPCTLR